MNSVLDGGYIDTQDFVTFEDVEAMPATGWDSSVG